MLKRLKTYFSKLRIVQYFLEIKQSKYYFKNIINHKNYLERKNDVEKLLSVDDYYLVTMPDKINPARLLETAEYQMFIFNYLDDEVHQYCYTFWANMHSIHMKEITEEVIKWQEANEDIEWEIKKILT